MTLLWRLLKPHLSIALALVLTAGGFFMLGYKIGKPKTPVSVQVAQQQVTLAHDTVHAIDTVVTTKTKLLAHHDTTYQQIRDTVLQYLHDTVVVKQFVQACDSLKGSCDAYRTAAQSKFHADSALFTALTQENTAWKASQPSLGSKLRSGLLWLGVGIVADRIAAHNGH